MGTVPFTVKLYRPGNLNTFTVLPSLTNTLSGTGALFITFILGLTPALLAKSQTKLVGK